jgi:hypothetical protein
MKRLRKVFFVWLLILCSSTCFAQLAVADGFVHDLMKKTGADQAIYYAQSLLQLVDNVKNTYNQLQHMIEAEKRALANLKSIADVRSFDDFMKWQNRQLYMEREVEDRYKNMGLKIGKKTYTTQELDDIPAAMRQSYGSGYWESDFTEDQREEMYVQLGLSPGNYNYVKKWSERDQAFLKKVQARAGILSDDNEAAGERYNELIREYGRSDENLDINQIAKNMHITTMQVEMVLRDIALSMAERDEREYAQQKLEKTPPTPPRLSNTFDAKPFGKITEGTGRNDE